MTYKRKLFVTYQHCSGYWLISREDVGVKFTEVVTGLFWDTISHYRKNDRIFLLHMPMTEAGKCIYFVLSANYRYASQLYNKKKTMMGEKTLSASRLHCRRLEELNSKYKLKLSKIWYRSLILTYKDYIGCSHLLFQNQIPETEYLRKQVSEAITISTELNTALQIMLSTLFS